MNKRVLYIPFFSVQDKNTRKFLLENDSNIHIMRCIVKLLRSLNCVVDVALPYKLSGQLYNDYNYVYFTTFPDNLIQRYHFNVNLYSSLFSNEYDLIINNVPELTKNMCALYFYMHKKIPKIISINHYIDFPSEAKVKTEFSYFSRQIESCHISSNTVFISQRSKEKFEIESGIVSDKFKVWRMSFSTDELDSLLHYNKKFSIKTIVFPNRISSTGHSSHIFFIDAIKGLLKIRSDFRVFFSNLTKEYSNEYIKEMLPVAEFYDGRDREKYLNVLAKCHIVFAALRDIHGGLSVREAIYSGCIPVIPKRDDYITITPENYEFFVDPNLCDLVSVLNRALDSVYKQEYLDKIKEDSFEYNMTTITKDLSEVLS